MKKALKRIVSLVMVVFMAVIGLFTMPTVEADAAAGKWTLVKDVNDLAVEDQVIIAAKAANYAMSTTQNGNNRGQAAITKSGDTLSTPSASVQVLTLKAGKTDGTFAFYTGSGYLYAASSSKNYLRTETTLSANSSWTITIASTGVATVKATGSNTKNWMRHNSSSSLFSCYSSGQADIAIYKFVEDTAAPSVTVSGADYTQLGANVTLTATVANTTGDVVWTSSNENVATVVNGTVTPVAIGKTTITAEVNGTKDTKEITVYPVANSELTIAQAIEVCKLAGTADSPYAYVATGVVDTIDTAYNSGYNNISVTITDGTNSIKTYRMVGGSDLAVGDMITVTGKLCNFQGNTPEFNTGCTYTVVENADLDAIKAALNEVGAYMSLAFEYTQSTVEVSATETFEATDTLNRALIGITTTSYAGWTGKKATSSAVYAGNSAGGNESIQLRTNNNNSGIVTTVSGGKAKKVIVVWNSNTSDGRTLNIYGSNTAYSAATDLYTDSTDGVLLGSLAKGETELTIDGDYAFIGLRSNDGAMYLTSIEIVWETEVEAEGTTFKKVYSDSYFAIKCAVDASLGEIANVDAYGIRISTADMTRDYTVTSQYFKAEDGKFYVVINLGDIINDFAKLGTEFTVTSFVEVDGITYESTTYKTYSVASMVAMYNELGYTEVSYLYNYFVEMELI